MINPIYNPMMPQQMGMQPTPTWPMGALNPNTMYQAQPTMFGGSAPTQNPQQNNWILQSQQATAAIRNVQEILPAPTGELLGLMDKIGNSFGSNRLSDNPQFTRALDLATGIPGGIPGYGNGQSQYPTYPLNGRTYDSLSTFNNPQANPYNPYRSNGSYPLNPMLLPPSVYPGLQYMQPNPYALMQNPVLVNPYYYAQGPNAFAGYPAISNPYAYGMFATPTYF